MSNLADMIEELILRKLSAMKEDNVVLRRNEMAEEVDCAPSQISYVLSTRFTLERGFIVESRRGSGGFVRIARIPMQNLVYEEAAQQVAAEPAPQAVQQVLVQLLQQGMLTGREAALITHFFHIMQHRIEPEEQHAILRSMLLVLAEVS